MKSSFNYQPLAQGDNHINHKHGGLKAVMVEVDGPTLSPNCVGGVLCPAGTIVNHEPIRSVRRKIILSAEISLHIMLMIATFVRNYEFLKFSESVLNKGDEITPEQMEEIQDAVRTNSFLDDCTESCITSIVFTWLMWNVFMRLYFFFSYKPSSVEMVKTPSVLARLFFPISTVYYHEENSLFNIHMPLVYFFGFVYSVFCYKPSYEKRRTVELIV